MQRRFNMTPSIWPIYGRIKSGWGKRKDPFTGKIKQHRGIDIPSWIGAPVKATADGIVQFSGWSKGFGLTVVINHNYGIRTIYAHLSLLLAKKNTYIKKGQIIGKIGNSGRSTAPHIHYEIREWNRSVRPNPYLGTDMFTAYRKLW